MNPFSLNSNWVLMDLKVKKWFLGVSKSATDACYYPIIFFKECGIKNRNTESYQTVRTLIERRQQIFFSP